MDGDPIGIPTLDTPRLRLRPILVTDADAIFEYAKDPEVSKFTLWEPYQSISDAEHFINGYVREYYADGEPEPLGITLQGTDKVIGTVGAFWTSKRCMELAYALSPNFWNRGLVTEASRAVMNYCFDTFDIDRFQSRCKALNAASARVMEKIGMRYEGTLRQAVFHRNVSWDMKYYSILRAEWLELRNSSEK